MQIHLLNHDVKLPDQNPVGKFYTSWSVIKCKILLIELTIFGDYTMESVGILYNFYHQAKIKKNNVLQWYQ